ncbi:hypothetical protein K458DRAFT_390697 [Lentithecium fluviatile CBS 122367]|uniref:Uncharacterized protein n=1 Tax=Lentithecium fluviatile CBS 122367 TaxID=1168545 RepID=A0A6G1IXV9_9PLEO|nr:hypothetical protein K458DRAFT_390697 [Lentithecium fluviatile CBS 122367]
MDIQRWLDDTVLPEQPPCLESKRSEVPKVPANRSQPPKKKRGRKRSTTDSSLLEAPPQREKMPPIAAQEVVEESAEENASSNASHTSSGSGSSMSSQPYARKPRRKTRPERYGPPSKDVKERGTHTRRHRKGESSKTKRKHKRKKADKPGTGIVQGFHAKNIPQDRLTLKPRQKLGLFSKGRASSPVKGRGLPDLVFSEMRFLQGHKAQPDAETRPGPSKKKRKEENAHAKEEAISAYFTSVRPALAEKDVNIQAKEASKKQLQDIDRREKDPSSVIDNAIPTVELADKASYLGFGSRGPRHESGSYVSWSESIWPPSATPARPRIESVVNNGQLDSIFDGQDGGNIDGGRVLHSRPTPPTVAQHLTEGSGGRFQVSSLAPANDRGSRSHSFPQHTSSPRRVNLVDRAAKRRTLESVESPSSMPPFIPGPEGSRGERQQPVYNAVAATPREDSLSGPVVDSLPSADIAPAPSHESRQAVNEDLDPQTLSSLGRILEDCNTAFQEQRRVAATYPTNMAATAPSETTFRRRGPTHLEPSTIIQWMPTVRFSGADQIYRPRVPETTSTSIYEQQQQRQLLAEQQIFVRECDTQGLFMSESEVNSENFEEVDYDAHEWEGQPSDLDGVEYDPLLEDEREERLELDEGESNIGPGSNFVANSGFWRPHRLY